MRRQRVAAVGERLDADRRLVRALQRLRTALRTGAAGPAPSAAARSSSLLDDGDVHRVLDASPDPYATATREKRAALARFEPHGVLISDAADRPDRRRFNEAVLDTGKPLHHLAVPMAAAARHEARTLRTQVAAAGGTLDWPTFTAAWFRVVRRVTLGDAARDDTDAHRPARPAAGQANWAMLAPPRPALTGEFLDRLRAHLDRAEPGSLAAVVARDAGRRAHGGRRAGPAVALRVRRRRPVGVPGAGPAGHPSPRAGGGPHRDRGRPRRPGRAPRAALGRAGGRAAVADDARDPARDHRRRPSWAGPPCRRARWC